MGLLSPPAPTFNGIGQSMRKFIKISGVWNVINSTFNAQGSRIITAVVVQVRASENICSSSLEALKKKERQDVTQCTTKIDCFSEFHPPPLSPPPWMLMYFICRFLKKSSPPLMTKLRVLMLCFHYFTVKFNTVELSITYRCERLLGPDSKSQGENTLQGKKKVGAGCHRSFTFVISVDLFMTKLYDERTLFSI